MRARATIGKSLAIVADGRKRVRLGAIPTHAHAGLDKEEALARLTVVGAELRALLDLLYFAGRNGLLVVLQGRDTSGKDGTIRMILDHSNAQSCRVEAFKAPTAEELGHDFLWRVHARTPGRGAIVLFNRSHYEDVLAARVRSLVPESTWRRRYDHINAFERLLTDEGVILVKVFLHISKSEQRERLLDREKDRDNAWKLSVGDWQERELWDDYTAAYKDVIERCGTRRAPWHVVPADHKWFRNLAVAEALVAALRPYRKGWQSALSAVGVRARADIAAYRRKRGDG
jgi:PPK2 family polyphosphate:nucleotide phosphotransferase